MQLRELQAKAYANSISKGFWNKQFTTESLNRVDLAKAAETIPEKLCLIHSEVSEALEDYRDNRMFTDRIDSGKPCGFPSELADIVIRVMDFAGALGIDLQDEIALKMAYNATREPMHGKVC